MSAILILVARHWRIGVVALALGVAGVWAAVMIHERNAARAESIRLTAQVADLKASNGSLQAAITTQNAAVDKLRTTLLNENAAAVARESAAAARGAQAVVAAGNRAAALEHSAVGAGCGAAITWANQQAMELGRWSPRKLR
ncbi:MAG TPA: hypothetical protein VNF45_10225 [Candidatus Binataceae bacterium]|nr:hypothetical protein [Candidatus Binataceae bacterium]